MSIKLTTNYFILFFRTNDVPIPTPDPDSEPLNHPFPEYNMKRSDDDSNKVIIEPRQGHTFVARHGNCVEM